MGSEHEGMLLMDCRVVSDAPDAVERVRALLEQEGRALAAPGNITRHELDRAINRFGPAAPPRNCRRQVWRAIWLRRKCMGKTPTPSCTAAGRSRSTRCAAPLPRFLLMPDRPRWS